MQTANTCYLFPSAAMLMSSSCSCPSRTFLDSSRTIKEPRSCRPVSYSKAIIKTVNLVMLKHKIVYLVNRCIEVVRETEIKLFLKKFPNLKRLKIKSLHC